MPKPKPPVFHIPIGQERRNGEVVPCEDRAAMKPALNAWFDMVTTTHPATLASSSCVIVGPNITRFFDLDSHTIVESPTPAGSWKPSATSDPPDIDIRVA